LDGITSRRAAFRANSPREPALRRAGPQHDVYPE